MSAPVIRVLTDNYAEDEDQAWAWMRSMHGLGYSLIASLQFDVAFHQDDVIVVPLTKGGAVVWLVVHHGQIREAALRRLAANRLTGLADPVTAARWWVTEKSNQPQPAPAPINPFDHGAQPVWDQYGVPIGLKPVPAPGSMPGVAPTPWNSGQLPAQYHPPPIGQPQLGKPRKAP